MSQILQYRSLFEIKMLHNYFLNRGELEWNKMNQEEKEHIEANTDIRNILEVIPIPECTAIFNAHNCIFRRTNTGIFVGIKVIPDEINPEMFKSFVPLDENLTFRFLIKLKDFNFLNYTALPIHGNRSTMYLLSNNKPIPSNNFPSLSVIPQVFKSGDLYMPGDMLSDDPVDQTILFTALVKTSNNPTLSDDWLTEVGNADTPLGYVNANDRYPVANGFYYYTMTEKNAYPIATIKDSSGMTINPNIEILQGDFFTLQVDLLQYPEGRYSIHVESDNPTYHDDNTFYLLHDNQTPFAMIEIKVKSGNLAFDLINQGDLLSPTFEIRFRNRWTHWRYLGKSFPTPYVHDKPLPLTRYGTIEITKPPEPADTKTIILPNPSVSLIKAEALINSAETKYYSEIHIN